MTRRLWLGVVLATVGTCGLVVGQHLVAEHLQIVDWTRGSYPAGGEMTWPYNLAAAGWLTGSAVALAGFAAVCALGRQSRRWAAVAALAAASGFACGSALVAAYPFPGFAAPGDTARLVLPQVVGSILGAVTGGLAGHYRLGPLLLPVPLAVWGTALTAPLTRQSDCPTSLGKITTCVYGNDRSSSLVPLGLAIGMLTAALVIWLLSRARPLLPTVVTAVGGTAVAFVSFVAVVGAAYTGNADHNFFIDPYERTRMWFTITVLAVLTAAVLQRTARRQPLHHGLSGAMQSPPRTDRA